MITRRPSSINDLPKIEEPVEGTKNCERKARIAELRFAVRAGTYRPDLNLVAERLVHELMREH